MRAESWEKNVAPKPFSLPEQMRQRYNGAWFPLRPREALKYGQWKTFKLRQKPQSGPAGREIFSHLSSALSASTAHRQRVSTLSRGGRGIAVGYGPYDCRGTILGLMFPTHTGHYWSVFFLRSLPGVKWEIKPLCNKRSEENGFKIIRLEWPQWSFFVAPKRFLHVVPKNMWVVRVPCPRLAVKHNTLLQQPERFLFGNTGNISRCQTVGFGLLFKSTMRNICHLHFVPHFRRRLSTVQFEIMIHTIYKMMLQLERQLMFQFAGPANSGLK